MKDQVEVLQTKGVKAAKLDSTLGVSEALAVKDGVRTGDLKILYVAPERSVISLIFYCPFYNTI
jgi:ATP-dependent DNA helicase RecQ